MHFKKLLAFQHNTEFKTWHVVGMVQSVSTGWAVRGSNTGEEKWSTSVQTSLGVHGVSCTMGTRLLFGV